MSGQEFCHACFERRHFRTTLFLVMLVEVLSLKLVYGEPIRNINGKAPSLSGGSSSWYDKPRWSGSASGLNDHSELEGSGNSDVGSDTDNSPHGIGPDDEDSDDAGSGMEPVRPEAQPKKRPPKIPSGIQTKPEIISSKNLSLTTDNSTVTISSQTQSLSGITEAKNSVDKSVVTTTQAARGLTPKPVSGGSSKPGDENYDDNYEDGEDDEDFDDDDDDDDDDDGDDEDDIDDNDEEDDFVDGGDATDYGRGTNNNDEFSNNQAGGIGSHDPTAVLSGISHVTNVDDRHSPIDTSNSGSGVIHLTPTNPEEGHVTILTMGTSFPDWTTSSTIAPTIVVKKNEIPSINSNSDNTFDKVPSSTNDDQRLLSGWAAKLQWLLSPGVLTAVIGGAVVGLLAAVLLVMFIVYKMRKKDEGSYVLDGPKTVNNIIVSSSNGHPYPYSYHKAPAREFYA